MVDGRAVTLCLLCTLSLLSVGTAFGTCEAYTDAQGQYHASFDCGTWNYCCGTCTNRSCCDDFFKRFSSIDQDNCQRTRGSVNIGISFFFSSSLVILFIILVCAFGRGCPIYKLRMKRARQNRGAVVVVLPPNQNPPPLGPQPVATYPAAPYPGPTSYPTTPAYNPAMAPQAPYYGPPQGPPHNAYPPTAMPYPQPGAAPSQPAFSSQPQPGYQEAPPPYPTY